MNKFEHISKEIDLAVEGTTAEDGVTILSVVLNNETGEAQNIFVGGGEALTNLALNICIQLCSEIGLDKVTFAYMLMSIALKED